MSRFAYATIAVLLLFLIAVSHASAGNIVPPTAEHYIFHGQVVSSTGAPVAGAEVNLFGAKTASIIADAKGRYTFALDRDFDWHTSIIARSGDLVSELLYLYPEEDLTAESRLGASARLAGHVREKDGAPVGDAEVRLVAQQGHKTTIVRDFTDRSGKYEMENIPPGNYTILLNHERFNLTQPEDPLAKSGPSATLRPGEFALRDLVAVRNAYISGRIVGPDGQAVIGHQFTNSLRNWNHVLTTFETNGKGKFSGYLAPWGEERTFRIEHPTLGFGMLRVPPLRPGERVKDLIEQLSGTMRLTGMVTGPSGEPVADVRIHNTLSDDSGRYDTGWIYLDRESLHLTVDVVPPGQSYRNSPSQVSRLTKDTNGNPVMYRSTYIRVGAEHGKALEVPVQLSPMESRSFRGTVLDELGNPVPNANVLVYQGEALTEQWISSLIPGTPPEPEPRRKNWSISRPEGPAFFLDHVKTNAMGRWESTVFPVPTSFACTWGSNFDPLINTIAVANEGMTRTGTARVHFLSNPSSPVDINIGLEPIGPDETVKIAIQNRSGEPLAGVTWTLNCDYGLITSDKKGGIAVPRIAPSIYLSIEDDRFHVLKVIARGTIKFAPDPADDPVREYAERIPRVLCHRGPTSGWSPAMTDIEWDKHWVSIPFFDTTKAEVAIVLGEVSL
jgi:protocatechuate 3,4-dioxygenase beta subunit